MGAKMRQKLTAQHIKKDSGQNDDCPESFNFYKRRAHYARRQPGQASPPFAQHNADNINHLP